MDKWGGEDLTGRLWNNRRQHEHRILVSHRRESNIFPWTLFFFSHNKEKSFTDLPLFWTLEDNGKINISFKLLCKNYNIIHTVIRLALSIMKWSQRRQNWSAEYKTQNKKTHWKKSAVSSTCHWKKLLQSRVTTIFIFINKRIRSNFCNFYLTATVVNLNISKL